MASSFKNQEQLVRFSKIREFSFEKSCNITEKNKIEEVNEVDDFVVVKLIKKISLEDIGLPIDFKRLSHVELSSFEDRITLTMQKMNEIDGTPAAVSKSMPEINRAASSNKNKVPKEPANSIIPITKSCQPKRLNLCDHIPASTLKLSRKVPLSENLELRNAVTKISEERPSKIDNRNASSLVFPSIRTRAMLFEKTQEEIFQTLPKIKPKSRNSFFWNFLK